MSSNRLTGIDVSKWQGTVDWKSVQQADVAFAFVRATYGTSEVDSSFNEIGKQRRRLASHAARITSCSQQKTRRNRRSSLYAPSVVSVRMIYRRGSSRTIAADFRLS